MNSFLKFLVIGACLTTGATVAQAGGKLSEILDRGFIRVGTGSTNAPFHFIDESGELVGFDVDMAKILAKGLFKDETKVEFVDESSDSRIPNILSNKVDIVCHYMSVTPERAIQVDFTVPYFREGSGLLFVKGSRYQTYQDLLDAGNEATGTMVQNTWAEERARIALPKISIDQYESVDLGVQAVEAGRADVVVMPASMLGWYLAKHPDRYVDGGHYWDQDTYACAVAKGDQEWLNWVNVALSTALTGFDFPSYAESYNRWFGVELSPPPLGVPVEFR